MYIVKRRVEVIFVKCKMSGRLKLFGCSFLKINRHGIKHIYRKLCEITRRLLETIHPKLINNVRIGIRLPTFFVRLRLPLLHLIYFTRSSSDR